MKILYIWDADWPWDVRVEKICVSLAEAGHEVHIAARNLKRRPAYEVADGLHVHRLPPRDNKKLNYISSFPAFFSPVWGRFLDGVIRERGIEAIVVRDLPMVIAGIWAGRRAGIPVVFDNAEDYVALVRVMWDRAKFSGLNLLVRNPYLARRVERYALPRVDHTLVVVDEMIEVTTRGGASADAISIVGNTPPARTFDDPPSAPPEQTADMKERWSAIYTGGIQTSRGLQLVTEAIPRIVERIPDFLFVVVGDGIARAEQEALVRERGVEDHVSFKGWVDHEYIFDFIRNADVGIIPHIVSAHVDTTVPNKLFDYMGCGIPVIASAARPMKRIIDEVGSGMTFPSGDSAALAEAVLEVHASDVDFGANGRKAIADRYNWEADTKVLLRVMEQLGA